MKFADRLYWYPYKIHGFSCNIYAIDQGNEIWLIDIGASSFRFFSSFVKGMKKDGLNIKKVTKVLVSHGHPDHISAFNKLRKLCNCTLILSPLQHEFIKSGDNGFWNKQISVAGEHINDLSKFSISTMRKVTKFQMGEISIINDFEIINNEKIIGEKISLKIINTPGHSPDHCSFFDSESHTLFSGDIFGRKTDKAVLNLPTSDYGQYISSLTRLIDIPVNQWGSGHGKQIFKGNEKYSILIKNTIDLLIKLKKITMDLIKSNIKEGLSLSEIRTPYPIELYNKIEQRIVAFCILNHLIEENSIYFDSLKNKYFLKNKN